LKDRFQALMILLLSLFYI